MLLRNRLKDPKVTNEAIASRAYQLWQARGCPEGDGQDDWQAAKMQLLAEAKQSHRRKPLRRLISRIRNRAAL